MTIQKIETNSAPAAIGPYSQAISTGELVFTAGQIPLDPATMQIVDGDIEAQTSRVLKNLEAVLKAAGSSLQQVVKTTIFLKSMSDFPKVNAVYAEYFRATPPARSTVAVAELPLGAHVEIEAIALAN